MAGSGGGASPGHKGQDMFGSASIGDWKVDE